VTLLSVESAAGVARRAGAGGTAPR